MKFKIIKAVWVLAVTLCLAISPAHAQFTFEGYSLEQLEAELSEAQVFQALGLAKTSADGPRGCYRYNDEMLNIREALIRLNQQYEGRADAVYHQKRAQMQEEFRLAQKGYNDCYRFALSDFPVLSFAGVRTLADFKNKVSALNPKYSNKGDIGAYIDALKNTIENIGDQRGKQVGVVESVFKSVEILRAGQGQWTPLTKATFVYVNDELRTGPRGRIRIKFNDRLSVQNAGPTVVNLGSSSHIKIEKLLVSLTNPKKREGLVSLMRGTIRAATKNWGPRSNFTVKAGATVCGIRGTEVAVSYDPQTSKATHVLDHGDAYIEVGGRQVTMTPRTSVTVTGDQIDWPVAVSEEAWLGIVKSTDDGVSIPNEDNNTPAVERPRPAQSRDMSPAKPVANLPIKLDQALETFRAFQYSAVAGDKETLLSILAEPERSDAIEEINKRGLNGYVFENAKIKDWVTDCAACYSDEKLGDICMISDSRNIVPKNNRKPGGAYISVYTLKNERNVSYILERSTSSIRYQVLRKKMKKNGRICRFDALTLNLSEGSIR